MVGYYDEFWWLLNLRRISLELMRGCGGGHWNHQEVIGVEGVLEVVVGLAQEVGGITG